MDSIRKVMPMLRNRFLEAVTTKYLILTVFVILTLIVGSFALIIGLNFVQLDNLTKFVDAVFKAMAVLLGMIWTLNRYYVGRTDAVRLRVDSDVKVIKPTDSGTGSSAMALLIYRLDVVNIGSVLIPPYQQRSEIESVMPSSNGTKYEHLYRWPKTGTHPGGPIEPTAWAAINNAISIPSTVQAIRIYIEFEISEGNSWTWHKTFDISKGGNNEKR